MVIRVPARMLVRRLTRVLTLTILSLSLFACANVKPFEREQLSESVMEPEEGFVKQSLQDKFYSTQEGAIGGDVGVAGGCGCAK